MSLLATRGGTTHRSASVTVLPAVAAVVVVGCALWALQVRGVPVAAPVDEGALMAELRQPTAVRSEHTLQLALSGNESFPKSADVPERTWIAIRALVDLHRFEEARAAARKMVEAFPDSPWSLDVQQHLLTNPGGAP